MEPTTDPYDYSTERLLYAKARENAFVVDTSSRAGIAGWRVSSSLRSDLALDARRP